MHLCVPKKVKIQQIYTMSLKNLMVYGIVILAMFFWSMTYIWYKIVFAELNPITVMTFRLGISTVLLFLFSFLIGKLKIPYKADLLWFILLSFFQPFLYFLAESYGVSLVSSTVSAVIISTIPVFTPIAAYLFLKQTISKLNIAGILVSFVGVLMVVLGRDLHFDGSIKGIVFLFCAVLSALGYAVIIGKLTHKYSTFTLISWQNALGFIWFLPLFFIIDFEHFKQAEFTQPIILNLIYLAVLGSSVAYIFFTYGIKHLGITKASLFTNLIPIFTAALAFYYLGEQLTLFKFAGIIIVISGLLLGQIKLKTKNKLRIQSLSKKLSVN